MQHPQRRRMIGLAALAFAFTTPLPIADQGHLFAIADAQANIVVNRLPSSISSSAAHRAAPLWSKRAFRAHHAGCSPSAAA